MARAPKRVRRKKLLPLEPPSGKGEEEERLRKKEPERRSQVVLLVYDAEGRSGGDIFCLLLPFPPFFFRPSNRPDPFRFFLLPLPANLINFAPSSPPSATPAVRPAAQLQSSRGCERESGMSYLPPLPPSLPPSRGVVILRAGTKRKRAVKGGGEKSQLPLALETHLPTTT